MRYRLPRLYPYLFRPYLGPNKCHRNTVRKLDKGGEERNTKKRVRGGVKKVFPPLFLRSFSYRNSNGDGESEKKSMQS